MKITAGLSKREIRNDCSLAIIPVDEEWSRWIVKNTKESFNGTELPFNELIYAMADAYKRDVRVWSAVGKQCKTCQFQVTNDTAHLNSGFHECWINIGLTSDDLEKPLVFELWSGLSGGQSLAEKFIQQQKYFLIDVNEDDYRPKILNGNSNPGLSATERRTLQIKKAKESDTTPYLDKKGLQEAMSQLEPPFHFIDFETTMVALPFHKGRRPYEAIAFQYSYHVMEEDGSIRHESEYLSLENTFPNYDFLRALKNDLDGKEGTIFRYHNHENTYLCHIYEQL